MAVVSAWNQKRTLFSVILLLIKSVGLSKRFVTEVSLNLKLTKLVWQIPGYLVETFVFVTIAYWLMGLRAEADAFLYTFLICVVTCNTAAACGTWNVVQYWARRSYINKSLFRYFFFGRMWIDSFGNQFSHPLRLHFVYNWRSADQFKVVMWVFHRDFYISHFTFQLTTQLCFLD